MKNLSKCCRAKTDMSGGGYINDDEIEPIKEYCTKCNQILSENGHENPDLIIDPLQEGK